MSGPWCPHGEEFRCERCIEEAAHERARELQLEQTAAVLLAACVQKRGPQTAKTNVADVVKLARALRDELER